MKVFLGEQECIAEEVRSLLAKGAIAPVSEGEQGECFLSSIFTVPKKDGGRHPIINLKSLNKFIPHYHFKMEGIQSMEDIILPNDYMIKLDLKDAFLAIPVHPSCQRYLCFRWEDQWSPTYLRSKGIRIMIFLDDLLVMAQSREDLIQHRSLILDFLKNLGFLVNYPKSVLVPTQEIIFLGFCVNTVTLRLLLPREKVSQAVREAQNLIQQKESSAR